jgi:hypothetical protein
MGRISLREIVCLLEISRNRHMLFTPVMHLDEGLSLETLHTLKVETSQKPERQLVLFFKPLTRNKASRCLEENVLTFKRFKTES